MEPRENLSDLQDPKWLTEDFRKRIEKDWNIEVSKDPCSNLRLTILTHKKKKSLELGSEESPSRRLIWTCCGEKKQ